MAQTMQGRNLKKVFFAANALINNESKLIASVATAALQDALFIFPLR